MDKMKLNIVENWQIDPHAGPDSLEAKQPYIDNGTGRIPNEPYYDPAFMDVEWDRLWTRVWLIAAVESDLPEPGDYSVFRLRHENIVVARIGDDLRMTSRAPANHIWHPGEQVRIAIDTSEAHVFAAGLAGAIRKMDWYEVVSCLSYW